MLNVFTERGSAEIVAATKMSQKMGKSTITKEKCFRSMSILTVMFVMFFGPAESCRGGSLITTGVTAHEKQQILEVHNRLRSSVAQGQVANQPGAQNMQEMVWDDELAVKAQQWANQCVFEHDPSRYLDRFTMGQNLAIIWSTAQLEEADGDFPSRIQNWFNEVRKYAWGASWSPATGHYSQLVWGDTNLVGCGFSYYQDSRKFNKLFVCNYGPGGNVIGSAPYAVGQPACSSYGMSPSYRYNGLCLNVNSQTFVSPQNNVITQNTYTFKSERVNPPKYHTYKKTTTQTPYNALFTYKSLFPTQRQQSYNPDPEQAYQNALNAYNQPNLSYENAEAAYRVVLNAYAALQKPQQPARTTYTRSYYRPGTTRSSYDWSAYFSH